MERTLEETFRQINEFKLLLPDFQREYKWSPNKQQNLLASVLLNFPIGGSLLLKGETSQFAVRKIGDREQVKFDQATECEFLLDGQQRTTTLFNAFSNVFDVNKMRTETNNITSLTEYVASKASPLKNRWYMKVPIGDVNSGTLDFFGAETLQFDKSQLDEYEPSDIIDVFYNDNFNETNKKAIKNVLSPFYYASELDKGVRVPKINTKYLQECADKGLIPLYQLLTEEQDRYIADVLERIASKIMLEIKSEKGGDFDYIKRVYNENVGLLDDYNSKDDITSENEYKELVSQILDKAAKRWREDVKNHLVIDVLKTYKLSSITTTDIRRAIPIFCHLNEGGMPLDDFDLISAKTARKLPSDKIQYSLGKELSTAVSNGIKLSVHTLNNHIMDYTKFSFESLDVLEDGLPRGYVSKTILSVCTILCTHFEGNIKKESTSTKTLLKTDITLVRQYFNVAVTGVLRALAFISLRLGISNAKKLHYELMLTPIAYIFANDENWNSKDAHNKLEQWYWISIFSGRYANNQSSVVIADLNHLNCWINKQEQSPFANYKKKMFEIENYSSANCLLRAKDEDGNYKEEPPSTAIRTGMFQYILSLQPFDFTMDKQDKKRRLAAYKFANVESKTLGFIDSTNDDDTIKLNDHHILPLGDTKEVGQKTQELREDKNHILNSPLNRTYISQNENLKISSMGPKKYFNAFKEDDFIRKSHCLPEGFATLDFISLETDAFSDVLKQRLELIKDSLNERLSDLN
jgi:hypothetical protein